MLLRMSTLSKPNWTGAPRASPTARPIIIPRAWSLKSFGINIIIRENWVKVKVATEGSESEFGRLGCGIVGGLIVR